MGSTGQRRQSGGSRYILVGEWGQPDSVDIAGAYGTVRMDICMVTTYVCTTHPTLKKGGGRKRAQKKIYRSISSPSKSSAMIHHHPHHHPSPETSLGKPWAHTAKGSGKHVHTAGLLYPPCPLSYRESGLGRRRKKRQQQQSPWKYKALLSYICANFRRSTFHVVLVGVFTH